MIASLIHAKKFKETKIRLKSTTYAQPQRCSGVLIYPSRITGDIHPEVRVATVKITIYRPTKFNIFINKTKFNTFWIEYIYNTATKTVWAGASLTELIGRDDRWTMPPVTASRVDCIRYLSTSRAHCRPSFIPQTIKLCPLRQSPAAKIPGSDVA